MLISVVGVSNKHVLAADEDKLLYDLVYDKDRNVLTGKTTPNANIFLTNLAGSIVANDKGEFEIPIPKGTKEAMIGMLDAEGDKSTDVRYNFEDGKVIETETTTTEDKDKKETDETKESTKDSEKTSETTSGETQQTESSEAQKSEDSSTKSTKEAKDKTTASKKKSLPKWIWGVVGVAVLAAIGAGWYIWKKQQPQYRKPQKVKGKIKSGKKQSSKKGSKSSSKNGKKSSGQKKKKRKK